MKRIAIIALIVAATAAQALADGKMFWREEIPPAIPYQRALILFDEGVQTLILQSRYEISRSEEKSNLGWVVPVPAVPEVASMPADWADFLFRDLSRTSRPKVTRVGQTVFTMLLVGVPGLMLLAILLASVLCRPQPTRKTSEIFVKYLAAWLAFGLIIAIFVPALGGARRSVDGVDVVAQHRVGIYDVSVVQSDDAEGLIDWLNEHSFKFAAEDAAVFDAYVSKGWCFVVALINPDAGEENVRIVLDGLAAPLILRFPHATPIYPVALTGTGGFETEILIYLASSRKMTSDGRVTLRFAGELNESTLGALLAFDVDPEGFFDPRKMMFPYLCKFQGRLTPGQMTEDLVFNESTDDKPFREHIYKW